MANIDDVIQIIENRTSVRISAGAPTGTEDIDQADLNKEIDGAVRDYSIDEPKIIMVDKVPGDLTDVSGVKMFRITDWDNDTSDADDISIEFPVDLARKSILRQGDDLDWEMVERPTGAGGAIEFWIKFFTVPGGTPGTWRLRYKTRYSSLSESATLADLTQRGVQMVGLLSAVYTARFLSGKFGKTTDPQIDADVVDYRSKSSEWRDIASALWDEYKERLDRPSAIKRPGAGIDIVDLDVSLGNATRYGRDFLVHRRRRR